MVRAGKFYIPMPRRRVDLKEFIQSARASRLQLQQRVGVAVRELCHVGRRQRDLVEELAALRIGRVGVVDRKHDAVDAEGLQRGDERRLAEDAAGGDPDLIEDVAGRPAA